MSAPRCRICGCELIVGVTWQPSKAEQNSFICRDDNNAYIRRRKERDPVAFYASVRKRSRTYRARHPEKIRAAERRRYAEKDPTIFAEKSARRRAVKATLTPPGADQKAIAAIYSMAKRMTVMTGQTYHVDHVVPLSKGGAHHQDNLVVMRADLNMSKQARIIPNLITFFTPYDPKDFLP